MKKIERLIKLLFFCFIVYTGKVAGQSVSINTDGSAANANAMLDVKSTNKGILIPRIDYNNRPVTAVPSGMLIYVIANGPLGNNAYYFYNGTKWLREKNSDDVQSLALNLDTLRITEGNYVVVGDILNLIGYYKCNTVYTQVASDNLNCGTCGNVCSFVNASSTCVGGACTLTCNAGYANCDNNIATGCEINITNNVNNCGNCGTVCPVGANASSATCSSSVCGLVCNAGFGNCDNLSANGCEINLTNNVYNCGSCGTVCPTSVNSSATCTSGTCGIACNAGFANCDNNAGNGCEVILSSNINNCGSCGTVCPTPVNSSATCTSGTCGIACNAGFANCDNNAGNGCEVVLSNNVNNCGSCGTVCPTYANSTRTCNASTCGIVCNAGFGNCDNILANGCEINLNTNNNNCGACGTVCPVGKSCSGGVCI